MTSGATPDLGSSAPSTGSIEGSAQGGASSGAIGSATSGSQPSVGVIQADTTSATTGASVNTDFNTQTSNVEHAASRAPEQAGGVGEVQGNVSGSAVEGHATGAMGAQGSSVMRGGTGGVDLDGPDPQREGAKLTSESKLDAVSSTDISADGAVSASGVSDPVGEVGRAQQLEFNQRDQAMGRVNEASDRADDARGVAADPSGAAQGKATDAAFDAGSEHAPVDVGQARADVSVATGAVSDPAAAAEGRVDVEVENRKRDATVKAGVSTTPKPDDDPTK
ncbi:MAG: hypothetical protein WKG01_21880 [Kofleriaceae bacterium]